MLSSMFYFSIVAFHLASCGGGNVEKNASAKGRMSGGVPAKCVYVSEQNVCNPNLHNFFANPQGYVGLRVSVFAFATYSSRGSLLIYPNFSSACGALDFSAMEVFPAQEISKRLENQLRSTGVARVVVSGLLSSEETGSLPVIGRIEKASVNLAFGSGVVLLENPKKIESGDIGVKSFENSVTPSCVR